MYELRLNLPLDPLRCVARLVLAAGFDQYVVYETPQWFSFAGGVLHEIVADRPLGTLAVPVDGWRAYGFATFELDLVHLVVPEVEARVHSGGVVIRAAERDALHSIAGLVTDDVPLPAYSARRWRPPHDGRSEYQTTVAAAVAEIERSRLDKVVVSRIVPVDFDVDLIGTYLTGRRANTPARSFLVSLGGLGMAGFSPETVLEVDADGRVVTRLLAGTRARDGGAARDALLADPKEVFEHAISVREARGQLTPVCRYTAIEEFLTVQDRGSVLHLASSITGVLAGGATAWEALATVLPPAAVTGVPRDLAREAIARLEPAPRGPYGGCVFTVGADGDLDAALVLRSVFCRGGRSWLRAGAGVVAASNPVREYEETCEKLRSIAPYLVPARVPAGVGRS